MRADKAWQKLIGGLIHLTFLIHGRKEARHRPWVIASLVHDLHTDPISITFIITTKRHTTIHSGGLATHHHCCCRITIDGRCSNRGEHATYLHQQGFFTLISAAFIMTLTDVRNLMSYNACQLIHAVCGQYSAGIKTNYAAWSRKCINTWIVNNDQTKRCLLARLGIEPPCKFFDRFLNPRVMLHLYTTIDVS